MDTKIKLPKLPKKDRRLITISIYIGTFCALSLFKVYIPKEIYTKYALIREFFEKYLHVSLCDMQVFTNEKNFLICVFQIKRTIKKKSKEKAHIERLARIKKLRENLRKKEVEKILQYLNKESEF